MLSVKRVPFVRQPSTESMIESGQTMSTIPLKPMLSRSPSIHSGHSAHESLRPALIPLSRTTSNASDTGLLDHEPVAPSKAGLRAAAQNACLRGAGHVVDGFWRVQPLLKQAAVPVALTALTVWCVVLTVYVARADREIEKLWDFPACEDLGLVQGFSLAPGVA